MPPPPPPTRLSVSGRRPSTRSLAAGAGILVVAALIVVVAIALNGSSKPSATAAPIQGTLVEATGGSWTNVTADQLAAMLQHKTFTLLNVKTPYSGEIDGTDLYIPYDQLTTRASELPADKKAEILVYCRSGHESAIAAQTLIGLGYTDIYNLDGGMTAWTASGRQLVTRDRSSS
jgi:rhodanese-related sulfurtransferase